MPQLLLAFTDLHSAKGAFQRTFPNMRLLSETLLRFVKIQRESFVYLTALASVLLPSNPDRLPCDQQGEVFKATPPTFYDER